MLRQLSIGCRLVRSSSDHAWAAWAARAALAAEAGDVAAARAAYAKAISLTTDIPTRRWLEARRADLTAR